MSIAGIVLIAIQFVVTIVSLLAGGQPFSGGLFVTLGYLSCGIVGVILLIVGIVKKRKKK